MSSTSGSGRPGRASAISTLALTVTLALAGPAGAQDEPPDPAQQAVAESLFEAGRSLMAEQRHAEACPKFEESNRIAPSAGTTLNLGRCLEAQGRTASAWAAYKRAIGLGRAAGQTRHVTAGEKFLADITPRLSHLRIEASERPAGLVVRRGGVSMGLAALGVPLAVDPGEHSIEASAPGRTPWSTTIEVKPDGDQAVVTIPELAVAEAPPPPKSPPPPAAARPADEPDGKLIAGLIVGGIGVAAIGVGAVFGVLTLSDASEAESSAALCPAMRCTDAGEAAIADAETKAWVSNVTLGVGAAAMIAGGVLVTLSILERSEAPSARTRAIPWATPESAGVVVRGSL
jgi:hypothetical protein